MSIRENLVGVSACAALLVGFNAEAGVITFDAGSSTPPSYSETVDGVTMTVTSLFPGGHLHFGDFDGDGSVDLQNHTACCSTPYEFVFSSAVDILSFDYHLASDTGTFTSDAGGNFSVSSLGSGIFDVAALGGAGWARITSFQWDIPSGNGVINMSIDNLTFAASSVPEPSSLALLGLGIWSLRRSLRKS